MQADFPAGATPIPNEHGTAPGIEMRLEPTSGPPCTIFALPGVPAEMKPMWHASVAPAIASLQPAERVTRHRRIKCFGVGESQLEAMLPDLIRRDRDPLVGITVSDATITLRITASGPDDAACQAAIEPTVATIREALGTLVFGEGDDELEHVVAAMLHKQGKTLAVVELATGGLIEDWLQAAAPSGSTILNVGVTAMDVSQLGRVLDFSDSERVELADAAAHDSTVATIAAEALRRVTGADVALGVAAFPPNVDAPDARVYASIATSERTRRLRFGSASHPAIRRARTAKQALERTTIDADGAGSQRRINAVRRNADATASSSGRPR